MSLIDLNVEEPGWSALSLPDLAERSARAALLTQSLDPDLYEISLLACDDRRIAELNGAFRKKGVATNVLSWPAFELAPPAPGARPAKPPKSGPEGRIFLGDVAIALQTTQREAQERSIPLKNHITHLILHACLHLLGFDHETDEDAGLMEGLEVAALARMGIDDPYH